MDEVKMREAWEKVAADIGHDKDCPFDWCLFQFAWDAALDSLPRMTEEEIAGVTRDARSTWSNMPSHENLDRHIARAIIAKLPHIVRKTV